MGAIHQEAAEGALPLLAETDWRAFGLVGLSLMVTQTSFYLTSAALPLYLHDLHAAQERIGLEVGLGNVAALAGNFLLGPWLNRYGSNRFLRLGGIIYLLASTAMLLFPSELAVSAARAAQGLGGAFIVPAALTLSARLLPSRQATALGMMGALNNAALAVGPPIGLLLYTSHAAAGLFLPSIAAALIGLLVCAFLPNPPSEARPARGFGYRRSWTPPLLGNALAVMYFGGIVAYLPLMLRGHGAPNAGLFFTADALGVLLFRIPTGMLADRRGSFLPKLIGLVITLPGILLLYPTMTTTTLILSGALTGAGAGMFITGIMADLSILSTEANRGTAMALGSGSFSGSFFIGSALAGPLIALGGFNAILTFGMATSLAALPVALMRPRTSA